MTTCSVVPMLAATSLLLSPQFNDPQPSFVSETLTVDELLDSYIAQVEHPATQKAPFSEATETAFSNWMKQVFGTEDRELQSKLLDHAVGVVPDFIGHEMKSFDYAAALHRLFHQLLQDAGGLLIRFTDSPG